MARRYVEDSIQAAIVQFIRTVAPDCVVAAIPNGAFFGKREDDQEAARQGARLKWTGVLPGIPDLIVMTPGGRTLFIEVKAPGGVLSEAQKALFPVLRELGHAVIVAKSIDDVKAALRAENIQTREAA